MKTTMIMLSELQKRFGYSNAQMEAKGDWIVVYSAAEKKHVRLIVGTLPLSASLKDFERRYTSLIRKAHHLGSDYGLVVAGTYKGGFRVGVRTGGARDGGPAWKLPGGNGKFVPLHN